MTKFVDVLSGQGKKGLWGAIALLSGIAMGLTNAPANWWLLAWIAQAPLWLILYHYPCSPTSPPPHTPSLPHLLILSCLWATGYYGTTLIWITGLHPLTWMGIPWVASVAIALTCWAIVTAWGCLWCIVWAISFTTLLRFIGMRPGILPMVTRVFVGTALWCGLDTLWSQGILYWPTFALTQSPDNLWLLQLNQFSGPITTTALIAVINGLLAESLLRLRTHPLTSIRTLLNQLSRSTALITVIFLGAIAHLLGAWLYFHSPPPSIPDQALSIGLIQGNIPTRIKLTRAGIQQAFDHYSQGYQQLVDQGVDLVALPEGAIPLLWKTDGTMMNPIAKMVGDRQIPAIVGTFATVSAPSDHSRPAAITQSLLMVTATTTSSQFPSTRANEQASGNVRVMSQYNKIKLVPLGEYIPAAGILGSMITRLSPMQSSMMPGTRGQVFETPWGGAIAGICYESAFPELFRQQTRSGGEFILTASNNDPYNGAMMAQHHAQDVMRAIESDRWMVRVTNTGYSGVVSPRGDTVWRSQRNVYETHLTQINRRQTQTLYVRLGNWLTPVLLIVGSGMIVVQWWVR